MAAGVPKKVAIVGSRTYPKLEQVREFVEALPAGTTVVSGGARGVDKEAERAARKAGLNVVIFPAQWDKYGISAAYIRNKRIVETADHVVAFWDGKSAGTAMTVNIANRLGRSFEIRIPD